MKVLKLLSIIFFLILNTTFSNDSLVLEDLEIYPEPEIDTDYLERKIFANINGCVIVSEPISDGTGTLFSCLVSKKDTVKFYVWNQDSLKRQYERLIYMDSLKKVVPCLESEFEI